MEVIGVHVAIPFDVQDNISLNSKFILPTESYPYMNLSVSASLEMTNKFRVRSELRSETHCEGYFGTKFCQIVGLGNWRLIELCRRAR